MGATEKGMATASKLNQDAALTPEGADVNASSKKEGLEKDLAGSKCLKDSKSTKAISEASPIVGENMSGNNPCEEVVGTAESAESDEGKSGLVGFVMEHPLPTFWFSITFLVLDIILLAVCFLE